MSLIELIKKQRESEKKVGGSDPSIIEQIRRTRNNAQQQSVTQNSVQPVNIVSPEVKIVPPDPTNTGMKKAYDYATYMMKLKMGKEDPNSLNLLNQLKASDIIVMPGQYDRVEEVFGSGKTPFTTYDKWKVANKGLDPKQIVFINCPGDLGGKGAENLAGFVERGGYLVTTDWALSRVIEKVFPGKARFNYKGTANDVVPINVVNPNNVYTKGMTEKNSKPVWWLETGSYPIQVLDKSVETLITSDELGKRYGERPVAIVFQHGKGKVFHVISHFYLQQTNKNSKGNTLGFMKNYLGLNDNEISSVVKDVQDISFAQAESTYSSAKLIYNIILDKMKANYQLK